MEQKCLQCGQDADPKILACYAICANCFQLQRSEFDNFKAARTKFFPQIDQILPNLFLGNEDAARDQKFIDNHQIGAVLVCGSHLSAPFENKVSYRKLLIADDPKQKIIDLFPQTYDWMQQNFNKGINVLVHCAAGVSRSASFVIAYIMKKNKLGMQQAHDFVKSKRPGIFPNSGFLQSLKVYEKQLQGEK